MTRSDRALRSFFGARVGGKDRPQNINTPQFLIDAILSVWPDGIKLDPCGNENSIVPASDRIFEPTKPSDRNGLLVDWPDFTYANPPYGNFKLWLRKIHTESEHMMLGPVRTNRKWFCEIVSTSTLICWLYPFPFLGHTQTFPASLGMFYWGDRFSNFREAFEPYGVIGTFKILAKQDHQEPLHFDKEGFFDPVTGKVFDLVCNNKK